MPIAFQSYPLQLSKCVSFSLASYSPIVPNIRVHEFLPNIHVHEFLQAIALPLDRWAIVLLHWVTSIVISKWVCPFVIDSTSQPPPHHHPVVGQELKSVAFIMLGRASSLAWTLLLMQFVIEWNSFLVRLQHLGPFGLHNFLLSWTASWCGFINIVPCGSHNSLQISELTPMLASCLSSTIVAR